MTDLHAPPDAGYIISSEFLNSLELYLKRPGENEKPGIINNNPLLCPHDLFSHDINDPSELEKGVYANTFFAFTHYSLATKEEWDSLLDSYDGGPAIGYKRDPATGFFTTSPAVCEPCSRRRKLDFVQATIYISKVQQEPTESSESSQRDPKKAAGDVVQIVESATAAAPAGTRRSRRHKGQQITQLLVQKDDQLVNLKYRLFELLDIPPTRQRLFLKGRELVDSELRVMDLDVYRNTVIDLLERDEDDAVEIVPNSKKIERGFEGTGLVSSSRPLAEGSSSSSPRKGTPEARPRTPELVSLVEDAVYIECPGCSTKNDPVVTRCQTCDTVLDPQALTSPTGTSSKTPDVASAPATAVIEMDVDVGMEPPASTLRTSRKGRGRPPLAPASSSQPKTTKATETRSRRKGSTAPLPQEETEDLDVEGGEGETEAGDPRQSKTQERTREKEEGEEKGAVMEGEVVVHVSTKEPEGVTNARVEVEEDVEDVVGEPKAVSEIDVSAAHVDVEEESDQQPVIEVKAVVAREPTPEKVIHVDSEVDDEPRQVEIKQEPRKTTARRGHRPAEVVSLEEEVPTKQEPVVEAAPEMPPAPQAVATRSSRSTRERPPPEESFRAQTRGEKRRLLEEGPEPRRTRSKTH